MRKILLKLLRLTATTSNMAGFYGIWSKVGYLGSKGWFKSFQKTTPMDATGAALPWFTYASIEFLEPRLSKSLSVFEFGSGQSTRWWSPKVKSVVSVEHDLSWYHHLKDNLPGNVEYLQVDLANNAYSESIKKREERFDIIVIDGRQRVQCSLNSAAALSESGVVVWDNSDRPEYSEGYKFLEESGFKRLDFWGMGPMSVHGWCTSIFYRSNNCLGI